MVAIARESKKIKARFLSFQVENKTGRVKFDVSASRQKCSKNKTKNHKHTHIQIYWKSFRVEWFNLKKKKDKIVVKQLRQMDDPRDQCDVWIKSGSRVCHLRN